MHAMLGKYVVHIHPEVVLVYLCSKNGRAALQKLFAKYEHQPVWVPYAAPGFMPARKVAAAVATHRRRHGGFPSVLFLQKHGVIVTADTRQEVLRLLRRVIRICGTKLTPPKPLKQQSIDTEKIRCAKLAIRKAMFEATGRRQSVADFGDDLFVSFAGADKTRQLLSKASLTPDELVYANRPALWVEDRRVEKIVSGCRRRMKKTGLCPAAFLVKGVGLFVAAKKDIQSIIRGVQASSLLLPYNAEKLGGVKPLTGRERSEARS